MAFFKSFTKAASESILSQAQGILASNFPDIMSETAIKEIEDRYDQLNVLLSQAKQKAEKEQKEADTIVALYNERISIIEHLQANDKEAAALKVLDEVEAMATDVEREKLEAEDANERVGQLQQIVNTFGEKLKTARATVNKAKAQLERAELQKLQAKENEASARLASGLSNGLDGLSTALNAIQNQADKASAEADAATRKAKLLTPVNIEEDPDIAAAKAAVTGKAIPSQSLADRLAAAKRV